jgi:hypothetical protein
MPAPTEEIFTEISKVFNVAGNFQIVLEVQMENNQNQMPADLWQPIF